MEYVQRELPYVRSFVLRSVYGVLRQEGITFGEEEPGRVIAEWREDGTDVSLSITAEEKAFGTELTVSLRRDPAGGDRTAGRWEPCPLRNSPSTSRPTISTAPTWRWSTGAANGIRSSLPATTARTLRRRASISILS